MRIKAILKKLAGLCLFLCLIVAFVIIGLLAWVSTGTRSLELVAPYIESALSATDGSYSLRIGETQLKWDSWEHPLSLHAHDVKIGDAKNNSIASFSDVGVRINLFSLLIGRVDVRSVELNRPLLKVTQREDGSFSIGFSESASSEPEPQAADQSLSAVLTSLVSGEADTPITRLRNISIRNARIKVQNTASVTFLQSDDVTVELSHRGKRAEGSISLPMNYKGTTGFISAGLVIDGTNKGIAAQTRFKNIPSLMLKEFFPAQTWLAAIDLPLSGEAQIQADFEGHVSSLPFLADAGSGEVEFPSLFDQKLNIRNIRLEGELTDRLRALKINRGVLDFGKVVLTWEGQFSKEGEDYAINAGVHSAHLPVDEISNFWPKSLAPHTRSWVKERISKGEVEKADVAIRFKPGELKLKDIPREAVDAQLELKGASVLYMPTHPQVTDINGHIAFTGNSMEGKVNAANFLTDSKITSGVIQFPDLNAPDVKMLLDMDVTTTAKDVQAFLSLPKLDKAKKLHLTDEIKGTASGKVKLDMIAFSEHETKEDEIPEINYSIDATMEKAAQPKLLGKYDVTDADMKMTVNNGGLTTSGKLTLNGLPMSLTAETKFNNTHDTSYNVQTNMPVARMPDFDLPKLDWLKGSFGVDATIVSSDKEESSKGTLDLKDTAVDLSDHGYVKKEGESVKLTYESKTEEGFTHVPHFDVQGSSHGKNYVATGNMDIDRKKGEISHIAFSRLTAGKHDLNELSYTRTAGNGMNVKARGAMLDLTPYRSSMNKNNNDASLVADVEVGKLILAENGALQDVKAVIDCPQICNTVSIKAALADKSPVLYAIHNGKLNGSSSNAGDLLRALDIHRGIYGGTVVITGQYEGKKMVGKLLIKDFTVKDAPILTRLFTIASLSGILDSLAGNGISFDKLVAPYEYERGNIALKDAKQYGSALGITATGLISLPESSYDIAGTLVPSYTLNSMVGKIPLLGDIIVGGEGKGLIALSYTVKGSMEQPSINANPLSVLTPGFLRGIFDVFDKPAPNLDEIEKKRK